MCRIYSVKKTPYFYLSRECLSAAPCGMWRWYYRYRNSYISLLKRHLYSSFPMSLDCTSQHSAEYQNNCGMTALDKRLYGSPHRLKHVCLDRQQMQAYRLEWSPNPLEYSFDYEFWCNHRACCKHRFPFRLPGFQVPVSDISVACYNGLCRRWRRNLVLL